MYTDINKGDEEDEVFLKKTGEGSLRYEKGRLVEKEEMNREVYDPSVRRSALRRTPPIRRTLSMPSSRDSSVESSKSAGKHTEAEDSDKDKEKRKRREEDSPEGTINKDKCTKKPREEVSIEQEKMKRKNLELGKNPWLREAMGLLNRVNDGVANLHSITSQSRNTKVEIKDLADELSRLMYSLMAKDWTNIEEKVGERTNKTKEMGIQVDAGKELRKKKSESVAEVNSLEGCDTLLKWRMIATKKWDPNLYRNTDIKNHGEVINTEDDTVKVIIVGKGEQGQPETFGGKGWERFPELEKVKEDYVILEQITNIRTGDDKKVTRKIIRIAIDENEEDLWSKLEKIREETRGSERVAVRHPTGRNVTKFRKMLEAIFHETEIKVSLYTEGKKGGGKPITVRETEQRETYALIVDGGRGKEYKEVLRQVRNTLGNNTAGNLVRGLRSTRDGKLLITTDRDQRVIERIGNILRETTENLRITNAGIEEREQAIYIRGLDALTTKEEVIGAVEGKIGTLAGKKYKISELRPTINDTLAVTIIINQKDAEKLVEGNKIRVGMVNYRVERKIKLERCYRCWAYEHKAQDCRSMVDRSKTCYKYGEAGHNARACKNEEACPICEENGHAAGSRDCKAFKKALAQARRKEREREVSEEVDRMEQEIVALPTSNREENGLDCPPAPTTNQHT